MRKMERIIKIYKKTHFFLIDEGCIYSYLLVDSLLKSNTISGYNRDFVAL